MANIPFLNNAYFSAKVGIGTDSPGAKLDVSGDVLIDSGEYLSWGTVGATSIEGSTASNKLQFRTNSSDRMIIDSSGNVGIGTTNPQDALDVDWDTEGVATDNSGIRVRAYRPHLNLIDRSGYTASNGHNFQIKADSAKLQFNATSADDETFDLTRMVIDKDGQVGIGTTSPGYKLDVRSSLATIAMFDGTYGGIQGIQVQRNGGDNVRLTANYNGYGGGLESSDALRFSVNGANISSPSMYIETNGNVGIGTTSPRQKLDISGNIVSNAVYLNDSVNNDRNVMFIDSSDNLLLATGTSAGNRSMLFYTENTERMRIDSAGNVGIGTTSPGEPLTVKTKTAAYFPGIKVEDYDSSMGLYVQNIEGSNSGIGTGRYYNSSFWRSDVTAPTTIRLDGGAIRFYAQSGVTADVNYTATERMNIASTGAIKFNAYDSTNNTGTPTYLLGTDASGNIVKTNTVPGSGAGPYLPLAGGTMTGNLFIEGASTPKITITDTTNNLEGRIRVANNYMYIEADNSDAVVSTRIVLKTDGVEALYLDGNQNATFVGDITFGDSHFIGDDASDNLLIQSSAGENIIINSLDETLFRINGSTKMQIKSSGNVGIGTTSPARQLTVFNSSNAELELYSGATSSGFIYFRDSGDSNIGALQYDHNGNYMSFRVNDAERMRIDSSGNVGIGTTSPSSKLQVGLSTSNAGSTLAMLGAAESGILSAISLVNTLGNSAAGYGTALDFHVNANYSPTGRIATIAESTGTPAALAFYTYNNGLNEKMRITSAGNVGIGTTLPGFALDVHGDSTAGVLSVRNAANGRDTFRSENAAGTRTANIGNDGSGHGNILIRNSSGGTTNYISGSGNSYFNGGNVGIGTTSPNYLLDVEGSVNNDDIAIRINNTFDDNLATSNPTSVLWLNAASNNGYLRVHGAPANTAAKHQIDLGSTAGSSFLTFSPGGAERMRIATDGAIQFNDYGAGTLVTDASGNITVSSGGGAGGPYLPVANPTFTGALTGPYADLEYIKLTAANPGILMKETDVTDKNWDIQVNSGNLKFYEVNDARSVFSEKVTFKAGGNVGIGVTDPGATLEVYNISSTSDGDGSATETLSGQDSILLQAPTGADEETNGSITWRNGDRRRAMITSVSEDADGDFKGISFYTQGTDGPGDIFESMRIAHSGNVGIGTTSPIAPLHITGPAPIATQPVIKVERNSPVVDYQDTNPTNGYLFFTERFSNLAGSVISTRKVQKNPGGEGVYTNFNHGSLTGQGTEHIQKNNSFHWKIDNTTNEVLTIHTSGNVGIGTTGPNYKLEVDGTLGVNRTDGIIFAGSTANGNKITVDTSNDFIFSTSLVSAPYTVSERMRIANSGAATFTSTVTATNFILSSDERLKENIEKVCDNRIKADWKTFELKTDKGQKRYGVIAQELEKTNPEFVREDTQGFKSVAYIDLLIAKIAELEARLEKLEK